MAASPLIPARSPRREIQVRWRELEPVRFFWRGRWRHILRVQEVWLDAGHWWVGEAPRWFYRVATEDGVYEFTVDEMGAGRARIYRVYD